MVTTPRVCIRTCVCRHVQPTEGAGALDRHPPFRWPSSGAGLTALAFAITVQSQGPGAGAQDPIAKPSSLPMVPAPCIPAVVPGLRGREHQAIHSVQVTKQGKVALCGSDPHCGTDTLNSPRQGAFSSNNYFFFKIYLFICIGLGCRQKHMATRSSQPWSKFGPPSRKNTPLR